MDIKVPISTIIKNASNKELDDIIFTIKKERTTRTVVLDASELLLPVSNKKVVFDITTHNGIKDQHE